jgi:hypothetical protein
VALDDDDCFDYVTAPPEPPVTEKGSLSDLTMVSVDQDEKARAAGTHS